MYLYHVCPKIRRTSIDSIQDNKEIASYIATYPMSDYTYQFKAK